MCFFFLVKSVIFFSVGSDCYMLECWREVQLGIGEKRDILSSSKFGEVIIISVGKIDQDANVDS